MRCIGARERCACATICTICASTVAAPTCSERITSAPLVFSVAPISLSPARLVTGSGSPVSIDSSTALRAFDHHAVHRHLLARPHAQQVADVHVGQRHVLLAAVGGDAARGLRRQAEQRADRRRGLRARLQFQDLAEQRQRDDHRRGLEVHRRPGPSTRTRPGTPAAPPWRRRCRAKAAPVPRPISVHMFGLRLTIDCAAAHEERPAGPQHDRQRTARSSIQLCVAMSNQPQRWPNMASTATTTVSGSVHQKRRWKSTQFGVLVVLQLGQHRLQRHAALRAVARMVLADLRMHRAGVDRAGRGFGSGRGGCRRVLRRLQVLLRARR